MLFRSRFPPVRARSPAVMVAPPVVTVRPEPSMPTPLMFRLPVCWVPGVLACKLTYDPVEPMLVGAQMVPFQM